MSAAHDPLTGWDDPLDPSDEEIDALVARAAKLRKKGKARPRQRPTSRWAASTFNISAGGSPHTATLQREPTQTRTIRSRYEADLYKRFRRLKGLVRETVSTNDAVRLSATLVEPVRDFGFDDDAAKEAAFIRWFDRALNQDVLEEVGQRAVLEGQHFTGQYVRASSRQGAEWGAARLRERGVEVTEEEIARSFEMGVHRDKLRTLYRRNYAALDGITDAVDTEVSRVLSEGVGAGENPRRMASTLNDRVDSIGITRARTMARTETMHAHHVHTETRYAEAGVDQVEIVTYQPCELCQALEADNPHPRSDLVSLLPRHPNCVCAAIPVIN